MNIISSLFNFIGNKIGNTAMGTTATTLTGAIAEHETQITELQTNPNVKWYFFSTGTQSWASGSSTYTITIPTAENGYYRWVVGDRSTNRNVTYIWALSGTDQLTFYAYNSSASAASGVINGFLVLMKNDAQITL